MLYFTNGTFFKSRRKRGIPKLTLQQLSVHQEDEKQVDLELTAAVASLLIGSD